MTLSKIIKLLSQIPEIIEQPPVLMDIGASKNLNPIWNKIAFFSIGIAFDADDRDFKFIEKEDSKFKKLFIYNSIVTDNSDLNEVDFYLTKSPYCSSTLKPNMEVLKNYGYADKFEVTKKIKLKSTSLPKVLKELDISYVDWFKTDSQGTDLRLFNSLPNPVKSKIFLTEFEPGIINAYENEDLFLDISNQFKDSSFQLIELIVKGPVRVPHQQLQSTFRNELIKKAYNNLLQQVPGWVEMAYFRNDIVESKREVLLSWLFSTLKKQHGLALEVLIKNQELVDDTELFQIMRRYSGKKIRYGIYNLSSLIKGLKRLISH